MCRSLPINVRASPLSWIGCDNIIDSSILAIVRRRWIFRDWIACARVIPHYQKRFLKKRFAGDEEAKAWCESEIDRIANMNREWRSGQKNQNGLHAHGKDAAGLEGGHLVCRVGGAASRVLSAVDPKTEISLHLILQ